MKSRGWPRSANSTLFPCPFSLRSPAFPLNELYIAAGLIVLIAVGLYFFGGAWGLLLLWGLAMVFVLPQVGGVFVLLSGSKEERAKGRRMAATAYLMGALFWGLLWLILVAYCGYHLYRAYRALP